MGFLIYDRTNRQTDKQRLKLYIYYRCQIRDDESKIKTNVLKISFKSNAKTVCKPNYPLKSIYILQLSLILVLYLRSVIHAMYIPNVLLLLKVYVKNV